jgi:hypothetical protein
MTAKDYDVYITWVGTSTISVLSLVISLVINQNSQKWQISLALSLLSALAIAFLVLVIRRFFSASERVNYRKWDEESSFSLIEAACLWVGEEPNEHPGWKARRAFRTLKKAVRDEKLSTRAARDEALKMATHKHWDWTPDNDDPINVNLQVHRTALKDYANSIAEKPKFLFMGNRP